MLMEADTMTKTDTVTLSIPSELMDLIRNMATEEYRSVNKQVIYLLNLAVIYKTNKEE